jgi:hypothetical protein
MTEAQKIAARMTEIEKEEFRNRLLVLVQAVWDQGIMYEREKHGNEFYQQSVRAHEDFLE